MILHKKLPIAKHYDKSFYSQNFVVGTTMVGRDVAVGRTQKRLIVIAQPVQGAGGKTYAPPDLLEPGVIDTRTIFIPKYEVMLDVDVLLIQYEGELNVQAILDKYKSQYDNINVIVYDEDVEYYD